MTDLAEPDRASTAAVVTMTIPARHDFVRLARLTASGLGNQAGFDIDEIEDLRIAIDELLCALVDATEGVPDVELTFALGESALLVEGQAPVVRNLELSLLAQEILAVVVDRYELRNTNGRGSFQCSKRTVI